MPAGFIPVVERSSYFAASNLLLVYRLRSLRIHSTFFTPLRFRALSMGGQRGLLLHIDIDSDPDIPFTHRARRADRLSHRF